MKSRGGSRRPQAPSPCRSRSRGGDGIRVLVAHAADEPNHGGKSYKYNWDCTICVSYRYADSVTAALEWRESRVKLRESPTLRARRFRGHSIRLGPQSANASFRPLGGPLPPVPRADRLQQGIRGVRSHPRRTRSWPPRCSTGSCTTATSSTSTATATACAATPISPRPSTPAPPAMSLHLERTTPRTPLDPSPLSDIFKAHKVGHFPCRLTHTAQVVRAWPPTRGYRPAFNNVDKWWGVPCTQWDWRGDAAPPF